VRVRRRNVLGQLNRGGSWRCIAYQRAWSSGCRRQVKLRIILDRLVDEARSITRDGRPAIEIPEISRSSRARTSSEVLGTRANRSAGWPRARAPGLESSIDKLLGSSHPSSGSAGR